MKSPLQAFQVELIEWIVKFLEPYDIASLRLTSRTMEEKASYGSFTALFKHKSVELMTEKLQEMVRLTSQGRLGCLLQHCTISGIVRSVTTATDEGTDEGTAEHLRLLAEAFRNLKQRNPKGRLASLHLGVAAHIEDPDGERIETDATRSWRAVWDAALRTFDITMEALNKSRLLVEEHLDVFGCLRGCSLIHDAFLAFAQESASIHIFGSLKRLTVSLSGTPKEHPPEEDPSEMECQAQVRHSNLNPQSIMQVLRRTMPELESLELHWYNLGWDMSIPPVPSAPRQEIDTGLACTTGLKECSLHGIYVSESDLLKFLEAVHPTSLTLTNLRLTTGSYARIFQYMTGPDSPVTYYHLDDLQEGYRLVHFDDAPGKLKFPYLHDRVGPSSLTRYDSREVIRFRVALGRALGSGARYRWNESKYLEFGPPSNVAHDFMELNSQKIADPGSDLDESVPS